MTFLFDIDGTLLLFRGLGKAAMQQAMHEVWGIPDALAGISFAGATDSGVAERVAPGRPRDAVWDRYVELLAAAAARTDLEPLAGAPSLLERLRGRRLGLLTGNLRRSARIKLDAVGLYGHFDQSISAYANDGDARHEIAAAARSRCGDGPITIIGDSVPDITCARHIGARVLAVATGPTPRAELEAEGPDHLVDDLNDVDAVTRWLLG